MDLKITESRQEIPGVKEVSKHSIFESVVTAKKVSITKVVDIQSYDSKKCKRISLNGVWKRMADRGSLEEKPKNISFNDFDWPDVMVPDNYGLDGELQRFYDPVWYRRTFRAKSGPYYSLVFQGVDYLAEVWLNNVYLGMHEGYFAPFQFDITQLIKDKNYLVVKVQDPCEFLDPSKTITGHFKKNIKGTMNYHDSRPGGMPGFPSPKWSSQWGQSLTTGGITQAVFLKQTGFVRIDSIFVTPLNDNLLHIAIICINHEEKSNVKFNCFINEKDNKNIYEFAINAELEKGANRIDFELADFKLKKWKVFSPDNPNSIYYQLKIEAVHDKTLLDSETVPFGIRNFELEPEKWSFKLNSKDIFIKAVNYIPIQHFSKSDLNFYLTDMKLIQEGNLNSIGIHAHIQARECYQAADDKGILVFQDFPLQWTYDSSTKTNPEFREKACKQIAEMVYLLYNHPSVVYWCCHNEPPYIFGSIKEPDPVDDRDNQILDQMLKKTVQAIDKTRFVHHASGTGGDLHIYNGSLNGGSIYGCRKSIKSKSGFVSEFGFWTIADTAEKWGEVGWPPDDDELIRWSSRLSFFGSTATFIGHPKYYKNRKDWYSVSQLYGAFLAKYQTEFFRSHKGKPFTGIRWHFFSDWWGYAGGGLVDKDRIKKLPYLWYKNACRPVILIADLKFTIFPPNHELEIPILAVNDLLKDVELKWSYKLVEVNGSRIIAGDTKAALLGGTGAPCRKNHKIVFPLADEKVIETIIIKEGNNTIEKNSILILDTLKFKTPNKDNCSFSILLIWDYLNNLNQKNWVHFIVGDINSKMKPGLHIISK
ncbi:MAG: glycoside hydrolase family 2 protein [Candidatus Helarchaeota archaeon]